MEGPKGLQLVVFVGVCLTVAGISGAPVDLPVQVKGRTALCPSDQFWSNGTCNQCSVCPTDSLMETYKQCTETEDTTCHCTSGSYLESLDNQCRKCLDCPIGQNVTSACSATMDTQCSACPEGTFHNITARRCQTCKQCAAGEFVLKTCTPIFETLCMAQFTFHQTTSKMGRRRADPPHRQAPQPRRDLHQSSVSRPENSSAIDSSWHKESNSDPLVYGGLALIIFVVAVYTIRQIYKSQDFSWSCPDCLGCSDTVKESSPVKATPTVPAPQHPQQQPLIYRNSLLTVGGPGPNLNLLPPPAWMNCGGYAMQPLIAGQPPVPLLGTVEQQPQGGRSRLCSTSSAYRGSQAHAVV
ncbi:hypothetical protein BV898_12928 [Hypsibius exemplaris]|uniref:TNFR-Cys domain-containing protein n=1 Tax=Hypsibius exemplaris TaxID=2072580 RepID=A0A1W0WC66_HYPEX|nr:hypothetical protein BV898_12928 [Hypsibius exemplaris]